MKGTIPVRVFPVLAVTLAVSMASLLAAASQAPAPQAPAPAAAAAPAGDVANGKAVYFKVGCYQCHGNEGQGGPGANGPRLAPNPMRYDAFSRYVRAPRGMPPYRLRAFSDQQMADVYAFLQSVPRPPSPDSIPLLAPSQFATQ